MEFDSEYVVCKHWPHHKVDAGGNDIVGISCECGAGVCLVMGIVRYCRIDPALPFQEDAWFVIRNRDLLSAQTM